MDKWQALEAMPVALRERVNAGWFYWDAYSILRYYRKLSQVHGSQRALDTTIRWLDTGDQTEARKDWRDLKGRKIPSPIVWSEIMEFEL